MATKQKQQEELVEIEQKQQEELNETEQNLISILGKTIDELNNKLKRADEVLSEVNKKIRNIDFLTSEIDIEKRFGFDGDKVYYIGVGSGRIYRKPINEDILNKIENVKNLTWKEIGEMGDYFMDKKNK